VVHVIAEERSLTDDTPVQLDGETPPRPPLDKPLREMTIAEASEALAPEPDNGPAQSNPAVVIGGGIMPRRCWLPKSRPRRRFGRWCIRAMRRPSRGIRRHANWPTSCAAVI
jgi:hypothetical protein